MTKEVQSHGSNGAAQSSTEVSDDIFTSAPKDPAKQPVKGAGSSSKQIGAISSGPFEISPSSFSSPPPSANGPPSAVVENAMERGRAVLPLSTIVGIGCAVFVVLVGLALLLFR